jgi:cell division protein ZapD
MATGGQFQQSLASGKVYQLLRLRLDPALQLVPEISGHRLMVSVRLMRAEPDGRLRPSNEDVSFELALCA